MSDETWHVTKEVFESHIRRLEWRIEQTEKDLRRIVERLERLEHPVARP
jgi:hypothetical protein